MSQHFFRAGARRVFSLKKKSPRFTFASIGNRVSETNYKGLLGSRRQLETNLASGAEHNGSHNGDANDLLLFKKEKDPTASE